jgi:hypothetical protein
MITKTFAVPHAVTRTSGSVACDCDCDATPKPFTVRAKRSVASTSSRALLQKSRRKVTSQSHERRKHWRNKKEYHYMDCEPLSSPSQYRWSKETPRALYDGTNVLRTCHTSRSPGSLNKPIWIISEYNGRNEKCACAEEPDLAIASLQSDLPSFLPSRRKNH